jgi:hypothetical protein
MAKAQNFVAGPRQEQKKHYRNKKKTINAAYGDKA